MAEVGLVALAMTFVIVTGGIDLSVGSILGLVAILLGVFWQNLGIPLPLAMVLGDSSVGALAGLVNGLIITRFGVPPLIATLATLALYRGLAEGISQARSVRGYPEWFFMLGPGRIPRRARAALGLRHLRHRRRRHSRTFDIRARHLCDRLQCGRLALFRPQRRSHACFLSTRPRASSPASQPSSSCRASRRRAPTWGPASNSMSSPPSSSAAPASSAARGTIIGTLLGLVLMQALKNGLALAGVKGDGTIVVIGAVLIARDPDRAICFAGMQTAE